MSKSARCLVDHSLRSVAALCVLTSLPAGLLLGANSTWTGASAVDSNWQTAANWAPGIGGGNSLFFSGTNRLATFNNFSAGGMFAGFTFQADAGPFVLSGNLVGLTGNIDNQSTSLQTINLNLSFTSGRTIATTAGDITINGAMSGAGGVTVTGNNTLTLTGTNTYTGITSVNSGKLLLDFGAAGAPVSNIINSAATSSTLNVRGSGIMEIDGASGANNVQNFNNLTIGGDVANKGGGVLAVKSGSGGTVTVNLGAITTNNGSSLDIQADGGSTITTTSLTSTGGIYSTRMIWNDSDWVVSMGAGTVTMGAYGTLAGSYTTLSSAGTDTNNSLLTTSGSLSNTVITNSLKLAPTSAGSLDIGAGHTLTMTASGLLFNSSNDFSIDNGTIRGGGGTEFNVWVFGPGTLTINSVVGSNSTNGFTKAGTGTLVLTGNNTYAGLTYLNQGVLSISNNANLGTSGTATLVMASGTLRATSSFTLGGVTGRNVQLHSGGGSFDVTSGNTLTISGTILNGGSSSIGSLSKIGAGSLILSGSNTYTGATTVSAGTLIVNGSLSAGTATTVKSGGTLAGTGLLNGSLTVASGGMVAPGNALGVLSSGNFDLQAGGTISMSLTGAAPGTEYSQLNVTGSVSLAGDLSVALSFTPAEDSLYFLLLNDGADAITGTFNGLAEGATFTAGGQEFMISYTGDSATSSFTGGNDVVLMAVAVPEPGAVMLAFGGVCALVSLRRRTRAA